MNAIKKLENACRARGVELRLLKDGHCQLNGRVLVNYYPLSKKMTAYVAGTQLGIEHVTPDQAVAMALTGPPLRKKENKVKPKQFNRNGPVFIALWTRQGGECALCHRSMRRYPDELGDKDPLLATVDHRIPIARGGSHMLQNLQLAHKVCNSTKGHDMPELRGGNPDLLAKGEPGA